jgi:hypothetical protein
MAQLKPVTTGGLLRDVNDNFAAISTVGTFAGLHLRRTAVAVFDAEGEDNPNQAVGAHALPVKLPANAIIVGGVVDVVKTFASDTDAATIALSVAEANDIVAAVAISNEGDPWDAGLQAIIPKANTPESTGIKLTTEKAVTVTVAEEALTAGKFVLYLDYYEGIETVVPETPGD